MDIRKIKKLIDLVNENHVTELELKEKDETVRIQVTPHGVTTSTILPTATPHPIVQPVTAAQPAATDLASQAAENGEAIESPMVGTIYLSPNPGTPTFVQVGQTVQIGDTVCLIEAMKTFNKIEADRAGKISKILVKDGDPVEYGQPLFIVE